MIRYAYILISSILVLVAWAPIGTVVPIFIAFIPLLVITLRMQASIGSKLIFVFVSLYFSSASITFWIWKMSIAGAIVAWLANSLLFTSSFVWLLIPYESNRSWMKWPLFILHWLIMEQVQLSAEFGYPFFILGNVLSEAPSLINWYSITGVSGGTLLILIVNLLIYHIILNVRSVKLWAVLATVLILPLLLNQATRIRRSYDQLQTVVLHPDVNCYNEKFEKSSDALLEEYINLSRLFVNSETELLVWPETAITDLGWKSGISNNSTVHRLTSEFGSQNLSVISGAILYEKSNELDVRSSYSQELGLYFKSYNAAFFLSPNSDINVIAKEKLVPFEEYVPYPKLNSLVNSVFSSVTGKKFSKIGTDRDVFFVSNGSLGALICFEVLFGNFVSNVSKESNALLLLMNEGWYDNKWASDQFWSIARVRAIENQRAIAISSNRGISGIIDYNGNEVYFSEKKPNALSLKLPLVKGDTFYSQYNFYLNEIIKYLFIVMAVFHIIGVFQARLRRT